jgi:hypothetical protein
MSKSSTPVAVRVARWTALAAAITALGSIGNTMWTERPWWKDPPAATATAEYVPAPKMYRAPSSVSMDDGTLKSEKPIIAMSMAPAPETIWDKLKGIPMTTWLIIGSAIVGGAYALIEYLHSRSKAKRETIMFDSPPKE